MVSGGSMVSTDGQDGADEEEDDKIGALPETLSWKDGTGETKKSISWISMNAKIQTLKDSCSSDNEILLAHSARSQARVQHATEEVQLVWEEMRQTLAFLEWKAGWWDQRRMARTHITNDLREGINAYALDQAHLQ
ncbi:unnamed protein product [Cyclocybe aegerita]|uniref:Uncharacterized protein n=1 Tax=Cyclocybe aegerita TaxID=1973307 RepID=A0A8S0VY64_CYCAE|nr:unnamed protein product [Cyclocybe aegerita]